MVYVKGPLLSLLLTVSSFICNICAEEQATPPEEKCVTTEDETCVNKDVFLGGPKSWSDMLLSGDSIVANGNVWPKQSYERRDSCLLLPTSSRIIRHCPFEGDDGTDEILYVQDERRFRGLFLSDETTPDENPTRPRRLWALTSPEGWGADFLQEIDIELNKTVQMLRIPGTEDAHDAVRVGNAVFVVDTRHGNIVELKLPKSAPSKNPGPGGDDYYEYDDVDDYPKAEVLNVHTGFTRPDHINNVAIHKDLLLNSLHGSDKLSKQIREMAGGGVSATRLTTLRRDLSGKEVIGVEGWEPIENAGTWNHGIAFWQDGETIKFVTLDSKEGSLVTIAITGPGSDEREREVLWLPDRTHPALKPQREMPEGYKKTFVFAKGLAVQGDVAFFCVSGARRPRGRLIINPVLFVAVDLKTKKELFHRSINSYGLIHQVVSESYLKFGAAPVADSKGGEEDKEL